MLMHRLRELLLPKVAALGYEFVGLEWLSAPRLLRVYIDHPERPIGLDDCEAVSRELAAALDLADPLPERYRLEISSPGLDRPLFDAAQFERFRGAEVNVSLHRPINGRRRWRGRIERVDPSAGGGGSVVLETADGPCAFALDDVRQARLVPVFDN